MNVGVFYLDNNIPFGFLYALANENIYFDKKYIFETSMNIPYEFQISTADHTFYFSNNLENIKDCDIKVADFHIDRNPEQNVEKYNHEFDYIFLTSTDGEINGYPELYDKFLAFPKVYFLLSHNEKKYKNHKKFICDKSINFFYFYHSLGFFRLNYDPFLNTVNKLRLVGVYNRYNDYKAWRKSIIDLLENESGLTPYIFKGDSTFDVNLTNTLFDKWFRQTVHMSSYIDYSTCVANLIFESAHGFNFDQISFTEKTLKGIIFQQANIFFIHYGSVEQLEWLHSKGFWFLNMEFYDFNRTKNLPSDTVFYSNAVFYSVLETFKYLKNLSDTLGSNDKVYDYLLTQYGHKLKSSLNSFASLMNDCTYKEKLINLITE